VTSDPWVLANRAAGAAGVELRPIATLEDADQVLRVMYATWEGHGSFPREVVRALADSGNVPYGAFDHAELIGYVLGWAGVGPEDGLHMHSHMLAAVPNRRHRGVGYALKLAQRAQALDQGMGVVRWTFDPLVARNALLNLHKLGAVADRFDRDHYGAMTDAVNVGERSDRFTIRWELEREPGPRALGSGEVVLAAEGSRPGAVRPPAGPVALVEVPGEYGDLRSTDPDAALAWRDASAEAIEGCLSAGLVAAGFERTTSSYVFVATEDLPP
jgi:predicted GNAT superfamily acetyltransferase